MSDSELDKSPIATKRARESSMEEEEEEGRALKIDPKDQVKIITQLQQDCFLEGGTYCLVSKAWFMRWKQYCSRLSSPQHNARKIGEQTNPGPINNQSILKDNGDLQDDLKLDESVFAVPEEAWNNLVEWYGTESEQPLERCIIKKDESLVVELYPPTFKLFVVTDATVSLERASRFTLSESSTISDLLSTIKESLDLSQDCELHVWLLPDEPTSPSIPYSSVQHATPLNIDNKFAAISRSGLLFIGVAIKGDARFPSEIKQSDSSSVSSASSIFANGFNNLTTTSTTSTPVSTAYAKYTRGVCGLINLGNTCFMNSALQCLSNTPELSKWFLAENYKKELNRDNPLGMKGQVAEAYGELIEKLWSGHSHSFAPRDFKYTIGKFNSSFYGYQQHDTQELLAFLLDGLHEDLNRIMKKPYIELPDFDGMEDKEIAKRSWDYHLVRNDSVIVDYFQGQFKSKLVCAECKNVSVTFDPFMYLSLPLPIKKKSKTTIVYVPYDPTQRMQRVVVTLSKDASIGHLQKEVASMMSVEDASTLLVVEIFSHKIYKVFPQYEPVATIGSSDIIYVYQLPGPVPPIPKSKASSYKFNGNDHDNLGTAGSEDDNQLIVFPVYCATVENSEISSGQPQQFGDPFIVGIPYKYANNPDLLYQMLSQHVERYTHFKLFEEVKDEEVKEEEMEEPPKYEASVDHAMDIDEQTQEQPQEQHLIHTAAAVTAAGGKKTEPMSNLFNMKIFCGPRTYGRYSEDLLPCSQNWSPSSLVDLRDRSEQEQRQREEYEQQQNEPEDEKRKNVDTEMEELSAKDTEEEEVENAAVEYYQGHKSPSLEEITVPSDFDSVSSNENNANSKPGSLSPPNRRKLVECPPSTIIRQGEGILLEWSPKKARQLFGESQFSSTVSAVGWKDIEELGDPDEVNTTPGEQKKKQVTLSDCLDEFTKEEALSAEDLWYCPKCKQHQMATKKFDLWHMPEIVVVHLKRFSHSRTWRDKIDVLIDFPIEGLDLTDRVEDTANEDNRLIYDLYAVDNHYGGLGGGHYTAYAQNFEDKNWYHFDDSHVTKVNVSDIKTSAAYLLFYKRRREQEDNTKSVEEIIREAKQKQQAAEESTNHESNEISEDTVMFADKQSLEEEEEKPDTLREESDALN